MIKKIISIVMLLVFFNYSYSYGSKMDYLNINIWDSFIKIPNQSSFIVCEKALDCIYLKNTNTNYHCNDDQHTNIDKDLINNVVVYNKFVNLIRLNNNLYAIKLAVKLTNILDGGNLEDMDGIIAMTISSNPQILLNIINEYKIVNKERLKYWACTYPIDEFVDDDKKRIIEYKKRISSLKKIRNKNLLKNKEYFINIINNCIFELIH